LAAFPKNPALRRTIARKILDLHGSSLDVESTVGEGTTFSFALPA